MAEIVTHYCACRDARPLSPKTSKAEKDLIRRLSTEALVTINKKVQGDLAECLGNNTEYAEFVEAVGNADKLDSDGLLPNADKMHPFCRTWTLDSVERAYEIMPADAAGSYILNLKEDTTGLFFL
jgi:hypothetical protein